MTSSARLTFIVAAVCAAVVVPSVTLGPHLVRRLRNWKSKSPEELEKLRRFEINRGGRITSGEVIDLIEDGSPEKQRQVVVYRYEVAGVTYEAAQEVTGFANLPAMGIAGLSSSVKYDPQKPMNSIIACEEWNGLGSRNRR